MKRKKVIKKIKARIEAASTGAATLRDNLKKRKEYGYNSEEVKEVTEELQFQERLIKELEELIGEFERCEYLTCGSYCPMTHTELRGFCE